MMKQRDQAAWWRGVLAGAVGSAVAVLVVGLVARAATGSGNSTGSGSSPVVPSGDAFYDTLEGKFRMLNAYTRLSHPRYTEGKNGIASREGPFDYQGAKTRFIYDQLVRARDSGAIPSNATVCEVGFNAGHSALLFLDVLADSTLVEFDYGDMPWALQNAKLFDHIYGRRFHYILGDSGATIPSFAGEHPDLRCHVLFVDGAKGAAPRRKDILNLRPMSHPGALVFGDETNTVECMSGKVGADNPLCTVGDWAETAVAYNRLVREDKAMTFRACSPQPQGARQTNANDLVCLWKLEPSQ